MPDSHTNTEPRVLRVLRNLRVRQDLRSDQTILRDLGPHPEVAQELLALHKAKPFDPVLLLAVAKARYLEGRLMAVTWAEWRYKVAAHPEVQRLDDAERALQEMEQLAEEQGERIRARTLGAVARHRSWIAYQQRDNARALEQAVFAYELDGWVTDLHNILCILVRLGEDEAARALLADARSTLSEADLTLLHSLAAKDPDLSTFIP